MTVSYLRTDDPWRCKRAEDQLKVAYREMLHNAAIYRPVYGWPEVVDGFPLYADGNRVFLVGFPLDTSRTSVERRVGSVIRQLWEHYGDSLCLEYWGPRLPDPTLIPRSVRCLRISPPTETNRDVLLSLNNLTPEIVRSYRFVRRAIRCGLCAKINLTKTVTAHHVALVEHFLATHCGLDEDEERYVAAWRKVLDDHGSRLFEVYNGDRLTGFAVLSWFSVEVPTYAFGFFDNAVAGTSDLAHAAMIEYALEYGARALDLGYSVHSTLLRYKRKWGESEQLEPPWDVCWAGPLA